MPATLTGAGSTYVVTPHGGEFLHPVEVSIPVPSGTLLPTQELKLAKAEPNGAWEVLGDSTVVDGKLKASVGSFSYFIAVVITYPLPIARTEPIKFDSSLSCVDSCGEAIGPVTATYTVTSIGGQTAADCLTPTMETRLTVGGSLQVIDERPLGRYSVTQTIQPASRLMVMFETVLKCPYYSIIHTRETFNWADAPEYPSLRAVRVPPQIDVVEGLQANLDYLFAGGAVRVGANFNLDMTPSETNRAVVVWQRSDDASASWREIARSLQNEANQLPFGTGMPWRQWGVRHGFIATATDQGARIRALACYDAPTPAVSPPCITTRYTRINVLQESSLPKIVDQPRSVLIHTAETASFSVNASGAPAPTLQWQTRSANSTGEWSDVSLGSGATSSNYTTAPRMPTDNGEQYRVVATNALGSASSSPVTLSVSDLIVAPSIKTQPAALNVSAGSDAAFAVAAYGTEALSYQWRFNGTNIDGANSPVLRLSGVAAANAGSYSVVVSNSAGSATSDSALLGVTAGSPAAIAPSIVTQPSAVTASAGTTAALAVGVAGTGPFTFQWLRDGVAVNGATSAVLTFNSVALPNAGSYSVRVTNSAGQVVSDAVTLDVIASSGTEAPTITSQPATLIVPLNGSGTIAVGATGSGPLSYQWYLDGNLLPGSTLPVLNFSHLGSVDFGRYSVTVTNSMGSVTSQPADLILLGAPVITQQPADATVVEGGQAMFFVQANGSGLRYQWSVNGTPVPGAIAATFNTPPLVAANTGAVYSVMVYNGAGLVTSQGAVLTVQVIVAPSVTQQPVSATIQPGQTAQICATFGGTAPMSVHFQRWDGSSWAQYIDFSAINNDAQCFPTPALDVSDSGAQFRVVAVNSAGQAASDAMTVTVTSPGISKTTLVSVFLGGEPDYYSSQPSISGDGRFVAFISTGTRLIPGGTNAVNHAYLRDLATSTTTLIDQTPSGGESSGGVANLKLSANGRYALFTSFAKDLVPNDTNNYLDTFRRDLLTGVTERVTVLADGSQMDAPSGSFDARLSISGDGRFVTFASFYDFAGNGDEIGGFNLYVRDMDTGVTRYVDGTPALSPVGYVATSENGRYIAYTLNVVAPNDQTIWLYDNETHSKRAGYTYAQPAYPDGQRQGLSISATGRFIAFAVNSLSFTGSTFDQIVVVDLDKPDAPMIASTGPDGTGDGNSAWPQLSGDGRYVLFETYAPNLTGGWATTYGNRGSVVRDLVAGTTKIASVNNFGLPVQVGPSYGSHVISNDGRVVAFESSQVYATPRP